ncbi:MAG TPA: helicase-related protein [Microbacteriaceae bacterium]|nr:helicase-related protein [Microbacteriaceae bacterium]
MTAAARRLRDLDLPPGYDTGDDALTSFYVPALGRATSYDRSVGYFRASSLSVAAQGVSRFVAAAGSMRLLVGAELTEADADALRGAAEIPDSLAERLASEIVPADEIDRSRLAVLSWLVREGRLIVKVAVAIDGVGRPLVGGGNEPYFHLKVGVLRDGHGDGVAFQGSANESRSGWARNFEAISVFPSWTRATDFDFWARRFEQYWAGEVKGFRIYALPDAVRERLLHFAPVVLPPAEDPLEREQPPSRRALARFVRVAPRLPHAQALAEATSVVTLQPHQRQVMARLADEYPRSWLVADEVGLGKTISAGMAMRRLLLDGEVQRVLILAPANVCRQWQDELFEKFGLWVPRLEGRKLYGAHPDDVRDVPPSQNAYEAAPVLIASSHLARRAEHQERVIAAGPYDLLVVDEAHHARQKREPDRYRPGRLLQLLDRVKAADAARSVWLLTATPMQVDQLELRDLLVHVGLAGRLATDSGFLRYFAELAKSDAGEVGWEWLADSLEASPRPPLGSAERACLERIEQRLGVVQRQRIERFGKSGVDARQMVEDLGHDGRQELLVWLKQLSPVGQYVTRHSRVTLKRYRAEGLLDERLADRDVESVPVPFTDQEQHLYDELDSLLDRLMQAHASRRGAGFVLTVYRRRLTSSWEAIRRTLERRLTREQQLVLDADDLVDELEDEEGGVTADGSAVDDTMALPMDAADLAAVSSYVERIVRLASDSKLDRLLEHVDEARATGQSLIVFTQFTDTLVYLRDRLRPAYGPTLGTFTGDGGRVWDSVEERWVAISKRDLVEAIRAGRITILLANDAASEGLNLQACSYLVNFDMPWNPMRAEQRIGRIDRLGQQRPVITVKNYFVPDTVEERVYAALRDRIDDFSDLLGNLQPILGATEEAFRSIFRAPRSERKRAEDEAIRSLDETIARVQGAGVDIELEDPMPLPQYESPPVWLSDLAKFVGDELAAGGRPVTFDRGRPSRDSSSWVALGTYGHPRLFEVLDRIEAAEDEGTDAALVIAEEGSAASAMRADRTPPEPVRTLAEVPELGSASSLGDAAQAAASEATVEELARRTRVANVLAARSESWEDELKQRLLDLVREAVRSEVAAARQRGDEIGPLLAWQELKRDAFSGFGFVEQFGARLGVEVYRAVPTDADGAKVTLSRLEAGRRLYVLIEDWKARMPPLPRSPA